MVFHLKMFSLMIFCLVWFLNSALISCSQNSTVIRFSVPENHHILLPCGDSDTSDVVWTHRDRRVLVTRQGSYETNRDPRRYRLQPDGSLHLLQLDDNDGGEYRCNQQLTAELQVLTGNDVAVPAGRTLLLPCSRPFKPKQRWFFRSEGQEREVIFTWFKNGTMKPERSRLSYENDALQIQDLQLEDAGQYQCKGKQWSKVTNLAVLPQPTSIHQTSGTAATPAAAEATEVVEENEENETTKKERKRPENALLIVAVNSLGLMILLLAAVCVLLTSLRCRRTKTNTSAAAPQRPEDTELQPWTSSSRQTESEVYESPSLPEETIHYASLGRQNWKERPCRTPPDEDLHRVIYSSIITRPASRQTHK